MFIEGNVGSTFELTLFKDESHEMYPKKFFCLYKQK